MKVRTHYNHDPSGAITPKTRWHLYAGNPLAPLRRKQIGSYTPEIDSWRFSKAKLLNVLRQTHALMQYPNDTEAVRIFSIDDDMGADQIGEVR